MAKNRRMRAVLAEQPLFFISREEELLIRMRDSCPPEGTGFPVGRRLYPVFSAWRQFAGNVFETQYRKAFSLPENAGQIRQRAFRPYGTRQLPHSGLSGRIGNPFAAHRPGGPPHTYYPPSYSPALVFRKNGNGPDAQHFIFFSIVCPDDGRCINDVPDDAAVVDGDCILLRDEGRTDAHDMEQVMFMAAGDEIVSERFSRDMFRFSMV